MPTLKLFIIGLPQSGKTEFIKSVSDFPLQLVEKKIVRSEEMVFMDYGRAYVDRSMVYLYAPADDARFSFLWESLHEEMHGFILLVDITNSNSINESVSLYDDLMKISNSPHVIAFSKVDLRDSYVPPSEFENIPIAASRATVTCICTRKISVRNAIQTWLSVLQ